MAAIEIKWDGLFQVAAVSLAFAVGGAVVFALGVVGLSRAAQVRETGAAGSSRAGGLAVAGTCFAVCAALVLYGLYLLIPQFH